MASFTPTSFTDGELHATLPQARQVYHVDTPGSPIPGATSRVDWAWDETSRHFLCELKDPEQAGALRHNPKAAAEMRAALAGSGYANKLAHKAHHTVLYHPPSQNPPQIYVVVVALEALTAAELATASLTIGRELLGLGSNVPVVVVNIAEWNRQFAPRTLQRL